MKEYFCNIKSFIKFHNSLFQDANVCLVVKYLFKFSNEYQLMLIVIYLSLFKHTNTFHSPWCNILILEIVFLMNTDARK